MNMVMTMNINEILRNHARLYPEMRPEDAVKLIYQNEFGGGHMITDPQKSLEYLLSEAERTPSNESLPLTVSIGNGLVRVNIAAVTAYRYDFFKLNEAFVESAELVNGNLESFLGKLDVLRELAGEEVFGFSKEELEHYLADYADAGYPMVSHSEVYRQYYAPAYRVVLESMIDLEEITDTDAEACSTPNAEI